MFLKPSMAFVAGQQTQHVFQTTDLFISSNQYPPQTRTKIIINILPDKVKGHI